MPKITDFSPDIQRQIRGKLAKENNPVVLKPNKAPVETDRGKANKTELAALRVLQGFALDYKSGWRHEGRTFKILDGIAYTPDWILETSKVAVEVKAEHIASRDSAIRFRAARIENPDWTWVWMRKRTKTRKAGAWEAEIWPAKV